MNTNIDKHTLAPLFYKDLEYYPTLVPYAQLLQWHERVVWLALYLVFWAFAYMVSYYHRERTDYAIISGALTGLLIFMLEYYYKITSEWVVINSLDNEVYKIAIDRKPPINDNWSIYIENDILPESTDKGYLISRDSLDFYTKNNGLEVIPLEAIYAGIFKKTINMGSQKDPVFFSAINEYIATNSFYITIVVLAWGMFMIKTKWFNLHILIWILLTLVLTIISGTLTGRSWNIYNSNYIIEIKKILLVLGISIATTSILMG